MKIDIHAHSDFDEVGDFLGILTGKAAKILAECVTTGEPVFVLRGKDIFTPMGIGAYLRLIEEYGPNDLEMQRSLVELMGEVKEWQKANIAEVRYPD
jgi:hypothetical protein